MTSPTHEFQVSVSFSQKNVIVSQWHICSFTSSVCFSLRWPGLISSFYPFQFWWGPKCLLSGIANGNPHKPHKSLKKLMAAEPISVLPLCSAATGVDRSPAKRQRTARQPAGSACSPWLKGHPHPEHFFCFCSIFKGPYCWDFQGNIITVVLL